MSWGDILSPEKLISLNVHFVFLHHEGCSLPVIAAGERTLPVNEMRINPDEIWLYLEPPAASVTPGKESVSFNFDNNHGVFFKTPSSSEVGA